MYATDIESLYEAFLGEVEVVLGKATSSEYPLFFFAISMHMWASTMQPGKVLLGNMVTLTLTRTEGVNCSSMSPMDRS